MKANADRFRAAITMFPKASEVLSRLDEAAVPYIIGGSVALYTQGNSRLPHDVDIMFRDEAHDAANIVFGLTSEVIERPNVSMHKSTPVDDGSIDFLSHYTAIADGVTHYHFSPQTVTVAFEGRQLNLVPAEKVIAVKLIGRRDHHHDLDDVKELMQHSDFDQGLFWELVDLLNAREVVAKLMDTTQIKFR